MMADAEVTERVAGDIELTGTYYELGYNLLDGADSALYPFIRIEEVESGAGTDEFTTMGIHFRPIDQICFKLDKCDETDTTSFVIGYVF